MPCPLHLEALGQLSEDLVQLIDLAVVVGRSHLDPETDLRPRYQRVGGQRHVDAPLEEEPPDLVDVVGVPRGTRSPGTRRC